MPKRLDLSLKEGTFLGLQFQAVLLEAPKDKVQFVQVALEILGKPQNVVKLDKQHIKCQITKYCFH